MRLSLIFLVFVSCLLLRPAWAGSPALSGVDNIAIERVLKMLNKPYVKFFKDEYGVVFDCVDIYKQPALDHPLLKNHTIQISPRSSAESTGTNASTAKPILFSRHESCPDGTVPIRRTLKQDLVRSYAHLGRSRRASEWQDLREIDYSPVAGQHFAQLLLNSEKGSKFQDVGGVLEVDALYVPPGQSSSAQIILVDDSSDKVGCVQTGWLADNYQMTGCVNMLCPGFVVTSPTATPGMVFPTGTPIATCDRCAHLLGVT
ncbi:hypothetical protein EJB05_57535 [Eragrostis curvula]|uniref:Neprosin activation peptide domain-containing protein n=1 Tax=Eragrostis curvula TaxID=38414 RepID=A0A5J9SD46_9POAL|nr:hypothetical protein EJB05_57535 [Eragrostis curvula]